MAHTIHGTKRTTAPPTTRRSRSPPRYTRRIFPRSPTSAERARIRREYIRRVGRAKFSGKLTAKKKKGGNKKTRGITKKKHSKYIS